MHQYSLKSLYLLLLFVMFDMPLHVFANDSKHANTPTECRKLTATGNPEYPPYLFRESINSNQLVGANAEILKELGKELNIEIDIIYSGPWSRAQKEVREGRVDLIAGAFFTKPRSEYMDYIYPAFLTTNSAVWFDKNKKINYSKKEDLIGLKGITVINNSFGQEFDTFAKEHLSITTVASLKQAFRMMKLGRVDYLLYEESPARAYATSLKFEELIETNGPKISSEGLYLTLSHQSKCNSPALREKLSEALNKLIAQGYAQVALNSGLEMWRVNPENI